MACACQNKTVNTSDQQAAFAVLQANMDCPFTLEDLQNWKVKLECTKAREYVPEGYTMARINAYLGVVLSAMYNPQNLCFYKTVLDEMQPLLGTLTNDC